MKRLLVSIFIVGVVVFQYMPFIYAASSATLKTWYYLGMSAELQDYLNLGPGDKVCQGFKPPRSWTVDKVSLYAEYSVGVEGVEKDKNVTVQSVSYVYVELREGGPDGTLLAYGTVYVGYLDWYDVQLSSQVLLSSDRWYYIVAYSPYNAWNIYYHNDGQPNNDGPAGVNRYGYWESLSIDLLIRYHAIFTINSTRIQQLKTLAQTYKPTLWFDIMEQYFPCDFYFDNNMTISDNAENYDKKTSNEEKYNLIRVFVHIQEYAFDDTQGIGPAVAIEYWYYYVNETGTLAHKHDWELHLIVFLNQYDTLSVMLLKFGHHGWFEYADWNQVEKEDSSHVIVYIEEGKHGAYSGPPSGWYGTEQTKIHWDDSRYKEIYVWDTDACQGHRVINGETYCYIPNWEGDHVYWDYDSKYYWPRKYGNIDAAWHKPTWADPGGQAY